MVYLKSFKLPSEKDEDGVILSLGTHQLNMSCYTDTPYPFKLFPKKQLQNIEFEPVTMFCGSNGSGKSTLLNIICEKLRLERTSLFNDAPLFKTYTDMCKYSAADIPDGSKYISSDDVFDFMLDIRAINKGVDRRREELFYEYYITRKTPLENLTSIDDYEEFKRVMNAKRETKNSYVTARLAKKDLYTASNGESAFSYFTKEIKENALYLLDEPENSLSPERRLELAKFIEDSARFYNCQFIISTHCPFLMAVKGAKIYDMDSYPIGTKRWSEFENVKIYRNFFKSHEGEF